MDACFGVGSVEKMHKTRVNITLVLIALHPGGVLPSSLRYKENLVRAMFTGIKGLGDLFTFGIGRRARLRGPGSSRPLIHLLTMILRISHMNEA